MTKHFDILALPQNKLIKAQTGQSIMYALSEEGIFLRADCGGQGRCAKCAVKIAEITSRNSLENIGKQDKAKLKENFRDVLACQEVVTQNLVVDIPQAAGLSPEVTPQPKVSDTLISRIAGYSKNIGTVSEHGLAVDLGTTSIAVYLCDLSHGVIDGSVSLKNPQILFGTDVMSRITVLAENPMVLKRLQQMVVRAIDLGIKKVCYSMGNYDTQKLKKMTVVGNPTMLHLLLGMDPSSIGEAPYVPQFYDIQKVSAGQLGFEFNVDAEILTLPLISGFLGADIIAAALAVDLKKAPFDTILADVGTNGELMASGKQSMVATSCATGPALEGAIIQHGMQAVSGAISEVFIDRQTGKCTCAVKGNQRPMGICGSGIISAVAQLLRAGIILPDGRFDQSLDIEQIRLNPDQVPEFVLVSERESDIGEAITLTQADIRNVQLAKGAFRTGIDLLCEHIGVDIPRQLLVAGAFGNYIGKEDALTIGMFPPMPEQNIQIVGNAAGEGAILTLFDPQSLTDAQDLAKSTQIIDLSCHEDFQDHFVDALSFPQS